MDEPVLKFFRRCRWNLVTSTAVAVFGAIGGSSPLHAQKYEVFGVVRDPHGNAVAYAEADVEPFGPHTYASSAGKFSVGPLTSGAYLIRVRRFGFKPSARWITIADSSVTWNVVLEPIPVQLATVQQIALAQDLPRVFDRARSRVSVLKFGPELLQEHPGYSVDDILRIDRDFWWQLRGINCKVRVFVDGKLTSVLYETATGSVPSMMRSSIGALIRMRDIAAIEAIRHPRCINEPWVDEDLSQKCKRAVLIWTKGFRQTPYRGPCR